MEEEDKEEEEVSGKRERREKEPKTWKERRDSWIFLACEILGHKK